MCGIAGVYCFSNKYLSDMQKKSLRNMKDFMHLRGPDASDLKYHDSVGLTHTRLSIIDTHNRATQPMESSQWILSFNGEIINFISLRDELRSHCQFETQSDTEVLLMALETWGIDKTLEKCAGMYAFLAYNKITKLFYAARDPLGIKPLYYYIQDDHDSQSAWFASTPATIMHGLPTQEWKENKQAIGTFFTLGAPFSVESTTKNIFQLPAAHYLIFKPDGSHSIQKYWQPQYQENFTMDELIQIIKEYKHADVKSALFMSGGIDSTFLGSILNDMDFFHLYSPEISYAEQVAKTYQRPLIVVKPNREQYINGLKIIAQTFGEPLMSGGIPYSVSYEARQKGYRMAISANGADELFFGYPRTPLQNISLPKHEIPANPWFFKQLGHIFRNKNHFIIPEYQDMIPSLLEIGHSLLKTSFLPDFPACASYRWLEILSYVMNDLNPTLDAASMANSLEVRVPFLDHRIVQGVLSWPEKTLCTQAFGRKSPLKEHLSKTFNHKFLFRPKLGFSIDDQALAQIKAISDETFDYFLSTGFIQLNPKNATEHYERDVIYLKNIIQAFHTKQKYFRPIS